MYIFLWEEVEKEQYVRYANLIITFLVSGIWHGVGLNFLFWGFLHGVYQVAEDRMSKRFSRNEIKVVDQGVKVNQESICTTKNMGLERSILDIGKMLIVFVLVDFAWLFFRSSDMATATQMVGTVVTDFRISSLATGWWFDYGMSKIEYLVWIVVAVGMFAFDVVGEKYKEFWNAFENQKMWVRWSAYVCVLFLLIMTWVIGVGSDTNSFLYQNF